MYNIRSNLSLKCHDWLKMLVIKPQEIGPTFMGQFYCKEEFCFRIYQNQKRGKNDPTETKFWSYLVLLFQFWFVFGPFLSVFFVSCPFFVSFLSYFGPFLVPFCSYFVLKIDLQSRKNISATLKKFSLFWFYLKVCFDFVSKKKIDLVLHPALYTTHFAFLLFRTLM